MAAPLIGDQECGAPNPEGVRFQTRKAGATRTSKKSRSYASGSGFESLCSNCGRVERNTIPGPYPVFRDSYGILIAPLKGFVR